MEALRKLPEVTLEALSLRKKEIHDGRQILKLSWKKTMQAHGLPAIEPDETTVHHQTVAEAVPPLFVEQPAQTAAAEVGAEIIDLTILQQNQAAIANIRQKVAEAHDQKAA